MTPGSPWTPGDPDSPCSPYKQTSFQVSFPNPDNPTSQSRTGRNLTLAPCQDWYIHPSPVTFSPGGPKFPTPPGGPCGPWKRKEKSLLVGAEAWLRAQQGGRVPASWGSSGCLRWDWRKEAEAELTHISTIGSSGASRSWRARGSLCGRGMNASGWGMKGDEELRTSGWVSRDAGRGQRVGLHAREVSSGASGWGLAGWWWWWVVGT